MKEYIMADYDGGQKIGDLTVVGELVRCKDCMHWRTNTQLCSVFSGLCTVHRMPPDGYCSEAKRKEE